MTGLVGVRRLLRSREGATALEFGLVALPFLMLVFGTIEVSRVVWTQSAMQFAVEKAARCAAVNASACGTQAQVQSYAASQMLAPGVVAAKFSYDPNNACGHKVSARIDFAFIVTGISPASLTLTAQSCHPRAG